jgi:ligand-binding sensor domain-containing protein
MKFSEAPDGTLWMAETNHGVRPVPLPWRKNSNQAPEIPAGSQAITFDDQGSLWIASLGDGIIRVPYPERLSPSKLEKSDARLERLTQRADLTADYVYCVLQDREGNIWFGTNGGVDQYRAKSNRLFPPSRQFFGQRSGAGRYGIALGYKCRAAIYNPASKRGSYLSTNGPLN